MSGKMLKRLIHLCDKNENEKVRQQIDTISFVEAAYMSRMSVAANNGNVIAAARLKGTLKQPPRFDALAGVQIAASKEALSLRLLLAASFCQLMKRCQPRLPPRRKLFTMLFVVILVYSMRLLGLLALERMTVGSLLRRSEFCVCVSVFS